MVQVAPECGTNLEAQDRSDKFGQFLLALTQGLITLCLITECYYIVIDFKLPESVVN